jgi:hypothetical protein
MGLDKEAQEFNEKQKRLQEYYQTEGRGLSRVEDELKKVNNSLGFLIDMIQRWFEDEEKRRGEEHRRSTYGMYDPFKHRTQRGHEDDRWAGWAADKYREPYRNPYTGLHRDDPPPYDPDKDTDPDKDSDTAA